MLAPLFQEVIFTLYGEKSVKTKMATRGRLQNCGDENDANNNAETQQYKPLERPLP